MVIYILVFMLLAHIVDDFYLQGWLANAKQRSWWENNAPDDLYKYDYIASLIIHSLSWSVMITLPIIVYAISRQIELGWFSATIPVNLSIHAVVDDLKANKRKINLIVDQSIHFIQIIITWILFIVLF